MHSDETILAAGGLLPVDARVPAGELVDAVSARDYAHPALPGRVVVRLRAENIAEGDDLEMAVLGFGAPAVTGPVGLERRRPLGFPAWPIIHDPKNARYALEVVKELKKAAQKAKLKPGHAKASFDALGDTLARSVPHFLPSFYEEAGRAFINADSPKYAARYFEKAREAERVHALDIDEDSRRDAFLEFALANAVSVKSLRAYAKELETSRPPEFSKTYGKDTIGLAKESARPASRPPSTCSPPRPARASSPSEAPCAPAENIGAQIAAQALADFLNVKWPRDMSFSDSVTALSNFFARSERKPGETLNFEAVSFPWPRLIGRIGAVAYLAANPLTPASERETLLRILELWASTTFATNPSRFRVLRVNSKESTAHVREWQGNDYALQRDNPYAQTSSMLIEYAASG